MADPAPRERRGDRPAPEGAGAGSEPAQAPPHPGVTGARPGAAPPRRRGSRWVWVLALLLAGAAGYLTWQTSELQSRNQELRTELRATRAELEAYRSHLQGARDRTQALRATLQQQLDELDAFLARDPAPAE